MKPILHINSISEAFDYFIGFKIKHPLVAVIDFSKVEDKIEEGTRITSDFYVVMFKNYSCNKIRYGRKIYDFQEGSLMCLAPKQMMIMDTEVEQRDDKLGWGLFFHPDLIRGTSLGKAIKEYTFFSYETNEALHLSDKEKQTLYDIVQKIDMELSENIDRHSQKLIVSNIELLLNYCTRYYDRQFITRKAANSDILSKTEDILTEYFQSADLNKKGLPTVKYLAEKVHLSANYLSDLLKRETGMNAQDHIHYYLIEEAKNMLLNSDQSVGELSFALGFEYPQYFSRLFKAKTGMTPLEYRSMN
ncbi:helix-turn-helix domain-containing protein [Elizabethkingia miricola]|uniref:Helix-turn-helix domain-containing protein n=1 Tax=Elizabethkingia miricola TaxID=172045 RepID=A0ABD5B9Q6_ELIMR|nr:helix-turn-helix domain-containing protein [Elizabethkingia miricola]MDQ8750518.1 helix-turn-helix domain-containing protein [Elizabethkingia miricola]NHQ67911.1 AraC family transcriptional regulator [Elizabethkingia miricola]NHQ72079.1 AraC family transcriptional regulator [Elizabethkingia miricola]NHQ78707.1 AraC family transcriptional regulator [Elizabethkingia miricola]OPB90740.1 transcriptional regulator [Elizabethkingia miricola]